MDDFHILVQTGRLLTDEFSFQIPVGDFNLLNDPGQAVELSNNEWRLHGNTISEGDKPTVPWEAHMHWVKGSKEAVLLQAELIGDAFFPTATHSNLLF